MNAPDSIRWVLFDLGGVLVRLDGVADFGSLLGARDDAEFWRLWLNAEWVQRFERGACTPDEFARGMVDSFKMAVSPAEFLDRFRRWPSGLQPGAEAAVRSLRPELQHACLSNCNATHWEGSLVGLGLDALFPRRYLSYEVGLVKPDPAFFRHVLADLAVAAHETLFLDDNAVNVETARAEGMHAELARNAVDAHGTLTRMGLCATR